MKVIASILVGAAMFVLGGQRSSLPMEAKAIDFHAALTAEQRKTCVLPYGDSYREIFRYTPVTRTGLHLKNMSPELREKLRELLQASLSASGYETIETIRSLEDVLRALENNPGRDKEMYVVTFFGEPKAGSTWAWRYEGHHLSLNFTVADGKLISSTPQFLGSNPAMVLSGPSKGLRALPKEQDVAFELLNMLSESQRKQAVLNQNVPADVLSNNMPVARRMDSRGIFFKDLDPSQRARLIELIHVYADIQSKAEVARRMKAIETARDDLSLAWIGSLKPGAGHYYRVQGKSFMIEYDNTQNDANHIHSVWRDFDGDFGHDAISQHYASANGSHGHHHHAQMSQE